MVLGDFHLHKTTFLVWCLLCFPLLAGVQEEERDGGALGDGSGGPELLGGGGACGGGRPLCLLDIHMASVHSVLHTGININGRNKTKIVFFHLACYVKRAFPFL